MLADEVEELGSSKVRQDLPTPHSVSSIPFSLSLGVGDRIWVALACSILLMFWEASFSFCFEILLNGILLIIGYYSFIHWFNKYIHFAWYCYSGLWGYDNGKDIRQSCFGVYVLVAIQQDRTKEEPFPQNNWAQFLGNVWFVTGVSWTWPS